MDGVTQARERALNRTLSTDRGLDLFCETILRGRRERERALWHRQTVASARPLIASLVLAGRV